MFIYMEVVSYSYGDCITGVWLCVLSVCDCVGFKSLNGKLTVANEGKHWNAAPKWWKTTNLMSTLISNWAYMHNAVT